MMGIEKQPKVNKLMKLIRTPLQNKENDDSSPSLRGGGSDESFSDDSENEKIK